MSLHIFVYGYSDGAEVVCDIVGINNVIFVVTYVDVEIGDILCSTDKPVCVDLWLWTEILRSFKKKLLFQIDFCNRNNLDITNKLDKNLLFSLRTLVNFSFNIFIFKTLIIIKHCN